MTDAWNEDAERHGGDLHPSVVTKGPPTAADLEHAETLGTPGTFQSPVNPCMTKPLATFPLSETPNTGSKDTISVSLVKEPLGFDIPDGGYGWVIVFVVFLVNMNTWGANSGFSIYLAFYLQTKLFTDSPELYALIGGLAIGSGTVLSSLLTYLTGKLGPRKVMCIGACVQLSSNLMASWSVNLWQIFLTQGVLAGIGMTMLAFPAVGLLPQWFRKKRTLAGGIAAAGSGAGGVMYNLAMSRITQQYSYKWALRAQGIISFVSVCVAISLIRIRTATVARAKFKVFDVLVVKSFGFYLCLLWVIFTMFGYVVLMYNLADFTKSLGYSSNQASVVSAMVAAGAFFVRPLIGFLADRYGTVTVNIIAHAIVGLFALAMWIPARNYATAIAFAFIEGGLMGSIWLSIGTIVARICGLEVFPVFFGLVWTFLGAASIASPVIGINLKNEPPAGLLYDPAQYRDVAIFVGCCFMAAALSLWVLRAWLVARDEMCQVGSESDNGHEFQMTVTPSRVLRTFFKTAGKLV